MAALAGDIANAGFGPAQLQQEGFHGIEMRQKPPHLVPHDMASGDLTVGDFTYLLHGHLDDMHNCILIHPYAGG